MSPERFAQITAAYGTSPARWPDAERAAAATFLAECEAVEDTPGNMEREQSATARRVRVMWDEADALDVELNAYRVAEPDDALIRQVLASMPTPSKRANPFAWRRPRLWASGVGLIGAGAVGAVGVAVGALMMSLLTPALSVPSNEPTAVEQSYGGTVFTDAATEGDDQ